MNYIRLITATISVDKINVKRRKKNLNFRVPFLTLGETQKIGELIKKAWTTEKQDRDQNELHLKEIWLKPQ